MVAEIWRSFTIGLGGVVLGVALAEAFLYAGRYRAGASQRYLFMALQRLGTCLGVTFIELELADRLTSSGLTFRTPLAFVCFAVVLTAILGILRDDEHRRQRARREGHPMRRRDDVGS